MGVMRSPKEPVLVPSCTCQSDVSQPWVFIISQQFLFSQQGSSLQSTTPSQLQGFPLLGAKCYTNAPGLLRQTKAGDLPWVGSLRPSPRDLLFSCLTSTFKGFRELSIGPSGETPWEEAQISEAIDLQPYLLAYPVLVNGPNRGHMGGKQLVLGEGGIAGPAQISLVLPTALSPTTTHLDGSLRLAFHNPCQNPHWDLRERREAVKTTSHTSP